MVKILDKYILKSFIITFATVFVILFMIFILQTVWLFIGELAGKDLDLALIVKFLLFKMPSIIPLVLPLSIVLSSIMTFGAFAENYEFAAMKSAGISLQRAMRGLSIFIVFLSIASFAFANNVIPYAEYKFINFRRNIAQVKPAMAIAEGQFSDIGDYNIKVDKKSGENGNQLEGVTIHKKSTRDLGNNAVVIKSKNGELVSNEDSNILKLILNDGYYYEDIVPQKLEERKKVPFAKSSFKKYIINIDLAKLNKTDVNDEAITNTNTMLNVGELTYTLDSLNNNYDKEILSFSDNIYQRTGIAGIRNSLEPNTELAEQRNNVPADLLKMFTNSEQLDILKVAASNVANTTFTIDGSRIEMENKLKNINNHWIALYDKFVIAYACFLMFFIGAPLGAIIRKGGLGLPIVFAILIFITFHFINTFGKKLAQENGITPFLGTWMSSIVLTPLAILLTYRATNDISFTVNFDWITVPVQKLFAKKDKFAPAYAHTDPNNDHYVIDTTDVLSAEDGVNQPKSTSTFVSDTEVKATVPVFKGNAKAIGLENKTALNNTSEAYRNFLLHADTALVTYLLSILFVLAALKENIAIVVLGVVNAIVFLVALYFTYRSARKLDPETHNKISKPAVKWLLGIPFYIFIYFYNKTLLKGYSK